MSGQGKRVRKAWEVRVRNWHGGPAATYYAATQGKARYQAFLSASDAYPDLRIVDLIVRRAPSKDILFPGRDSRADAMTDEERHCLLHAFGADTTDPTKAGYRDYFYTRRDNPTLVSLSRQGLMTPMEGDKWGEGMTYFVMTAAGKEVALSLVPEYSQ